MRPKPTPGSCGRCGEGMPCHRRQRRAWRGRCRDRPLSRSAQIAASVLVAALRVRHRAGRSAGCTRCSPSPRSRNDQGAAGRCPTDFVPAGWQKALRDDRGQLRRSLWETALAVAVRDALRSGDLYLPHSRQHAGFWSLVLNEQLWASSRTACYADLGLSVRPAEHLAQLAREIGSAATAFADGLAAQLCPHRSG